MVYDKAYRLYINMYTYTILAGVAGQCHHQRCSMETWEILKIAGYLGIFRTSNMVIYGDLIGFHGDIKGIYELGWFFWAKQWDSTPQAHPQVVWTWTFHRHSEVDELLLGHCFTRKPGDRKNFQESNLALKIPEANGGLKRNVPSGYD